MPLWPNRSYPRWHQGHGQLSTDTPICKRKQNSGERFRATLPSLFNKIPRKKLVLKFSGFAEISLSLILLLWFHGTLCNVIINMTLCANGYDVMQYKKLSHLKLYNFYKKENSNLCHEYAIYFIS